MRKAKFFAAALLAMSSLGAFAQHQFTVQANKPGAEIQPTMYGIFFEDINFGADGREPFLRVSTAPDGMEYIRKCNPQRC